MRRKARSKKGDRAQSLSPAIVRGYERYLKIALRLPGAEEVTSYGTRGVKIRGKILSRWRTEAEGGLAIRCDFLDRQMLLQAEPKVFFLTDHYRDYPMILVHLDRIRPDALGDLVERAWQMVAPPALLRARQKLLPSA
ncbi:MAG TPA: MmcQ/YjbR family DNA-binding protein [Steroidobacteraceae bacterium]|nr:MmcQ/YjbR family DNA-binding protein [Steroidobacteraceae bacterium]